MRTRGDIGHRAASAGRAGGYARDTATRELAYAVAALGKAVGALARELPS
ncbi:hypothetical protein J2W56_002895 [Nocardia kruczakiae]|uniref:Uncharacterized protein n=1 Tax=Nocardia kruczakiae TaxID=261477 RepID=A0ABU1XF40_9NOCA|nr:hypothetical protein [Nocardia kruczakiae]MDR7169154.1 hypothetical protein [Nocardia kruczakiae]